MANIPVNANDRVVTVVATSSGQTDFDFDFLAFTIDQIAARHIRVSDGAITELTHTSDFSATGLNNANGGSITLLNTVVAVGDKVVIYGETPIQRLSDFQQSGDFKAATVNTEEDLQIMMMQEIQRDQGRALMAPIGESLGEINVGNGQIIKKKDDGSGFVGVDTQLTVTNEDTIFQTRAAASAGQAAALPDGTIVSLGGLSYVVDSTATGSNSATNDLGQDGLRVFAAARARRDFAVTPQHFASDSQLVTDADDAMVAAANAATSSPGGKLVLPKGLYLISTGLNLLRDGLVIEGEGRHLSQIVAKTEGGDILSRQWNTAAANDYLQDVVLRDFGIIMRHPATAAPANYDQVALNCRHVTRSQFERLYIGNYPRGLSADSYGQPDSHANARQGIGMSAGTTSVGDVAYSGGEVNTHRDVMVAGAAKGFVLDDPDFYNTGYSSAAYIHLFDHCEAQIVEMGFGQLSQYGAGHTFRDCIVQSVGQATGSSETTYEFRIDGYDNTVIGGYGEAAGADHEFYFASASKRNRVYHRLNSGATNPTDLGTDNLIERINKTTGRHELFYNGKDMNVGRAEAFVTWSVSGGVVTIMDSWGVAGVTRNGAGDFTINFDTGTFANDKYAYALSGSVNTSGHAGVVYPYDGDDIDQTQIRLLSRNVSSDAFQDFMKYSAVFFAGQ